MKDPNLRRCSHAARGVWIDILCLMHENQERGYLATSGVAWSDEEIAQAVGGDKSIVLVCIGELTVKGAAKRDNRGSLYNSRMVADEQKRKLCGVAGRNGGGNPTFAKGEDKGSPKGHYKGHPKRIPEDDVGSVIDSSVSAGKGDRGKPKLCLVKTGMAKDNFPEEWERWVGYRSELGEPLTSYTASSLMGKCERWGSSKSVRLIRLAISKSWKNLLDDHELIQHGKTSPSKVRPVNPPERAPEWMTPVEEIKRLLPDCDANRARLIELGNALPGEAWTFISSTFNGVSEINPLRELLKGAA